MATYRVEFTAHIDVTADSPEEAQRIAEGWNVDEIYNNIEAEINFGAEYWDCIDEDDYICV